MDCLIDGRVPNAEEAEFREIDSRFTSHWDNPMVTQCCIHISRIVRGAENPMGPELPDFSL